MAGNRQAFEIAMDQGHSAAWEQSWDLAQDYYRRALTEFPDNPQALVSLGLALFELQMDEEALRCYLKAARLAPDDPMPAEKISQLYQRMGNSQRASQAALHSAELYLKNYDLRKTTEAWERVTQLQPDDPKAYARLAAVYERSGEKERATDAYLALARLQQAAGDLDQAAASVERAIAIEPASPQALQFQSLLKASQPLPAVSRKPVQAFSTQAKQFNQVPLPPDDSELDPVESTSQQAVRTLASLLFESAEMDLAPQNGSQPFDPLMPVATGQLSASDRRGLFLHLSQLIDLQTRSDYEAAAGELQKAVDLGLAHSAVAFDLGYLSARCGRPESAIAYLQPALDHPDFEFGARLLSGILYQQMDLATEASLEYLEALKLADLQISSPTARESLRQQYDALIEAFRLQPAQEIQARLVADTHALLMRPDWRDQLQRAHSQLSEPGLPRPLAEVLTMAGGNRLITTLARVREMKAGRHIRSAMEEVYFALDIAPLYLPLHTLTAELLVDLGEIQPAIEKLKIIARVYSMRLQSSQAIALHRKVIELAPIDVDVRKVLISELISSGQVDEAAQQMIRLAEVYMSLADLAQARSTYENILRLEGFSRIGLNARIDVLKRLADIDLKSLDWKHAVRVYEQVRALQPEDEEARYQLVQLSFRLGQDNRAVKELAEYVKILNNYGSHSQVLVLLEEFARDFPEKIPLRRLLAEAYCQQGNSTQAIAQLDWIGEELLSKGDRLGAIGCIQQIISLNPPNKTDYELLLSQLNPGKS